jgi:hypothetical protein
MYSPSSSPAQLDSEEVVENIVSLFMIGEVEKFKFPRMMGSGTYGSEKDDGG